MLDETDDPVLLHAFDAAQELDALVLVPTSVGEVLRSTAPAERSDTHRLWEARTMATPAGPRDSWWIRANIVRAERGADFTWSIEAADAEAGPWLEIGHGRHDPDGIGALTWDLLATGDLLELDVEGEIEVFYEESGSDREISVELTRNGASRQFGIAGRNVFAWTGLFGLTEDGLVWPGSAQVLLMDDHTGRSRGAIQRPEGEITFETCWNADGEQVWAEASDPAIPAVGVPGDCTVPDLFESQDGA